MEATSVVLAGLFFLGVNIPCIAVAWIGIKFFEELGRYPSKTAAIQIGICLKLLVVEIASFTFLLALFKVLSPEG